MLLDNLKGLICDLDGTLVETNKDYVCGIVNNTLKEVGVKKRATEEEAYKRFWYGIDRDKEIKKMWDIDPKIFWPIFRKYDTIECRISNTSVFDDVFILKKLDGILKKGIFTSSQEGHALAEKKIVEPYFGAINCFVISGVNGLSYKPNPDGLYECLRLLDVDAKKTAMVGDSALDILAAEAAGVISVFVRRKNSNLGRCMPNFEIQDLYGLFWL